MRGAAQYRGVVFKDPRFIKYFNIATPSGELSRMNIGSRPAKRKQNAGVESLRAIPWIFAWTQTRLQLPVWLGIGAAFESAVANGKLGTLQDMYREWPFFKVTLDLVEMVLAKANPRITELYDTELLTDPELAGFGGYLRGLLADMQRTLLAVTQHASLLEGPASGTPGGVQTLKEKLDQRAPYIMPLNMLQVRYLRLERSAAEGGGVEAAAAGGAAKVPFARELLALNANESAYLNAIEDTLMITVKGIAAGMQNTG